MFILRAMLQAKLLTIAGFGIVLLGMIWADAPIFLIPRSILGLIYLLFVPGYLMQLIAFPSKEEFDSYERSALAIGLSLALIPLLAIGIDYSPFPVNSASIVFTETVSISVLLLLAGWRQWRSNRIQPYPDFWSTLPNSAILSEKLSLRERGLFLIIAFAAGIVILSSLANLWLQGAGADFSEFYLLGANGLAEDYPRSAVVNEASLITVGISNREAEAELYFVEVWQNGVLIGAINSPRLAPNETWESPLSFTPSTAALNAQIDFYLFRESARTERYLSLQLWLDVLEN